MMPRPWLISTALPFLIAGGSCDDPEPVVVRAPSPSTKQPANQQPKSGGKNTRETGRTQDKQPAPAEDLLTYPRDKDRVMATVNGRNITLDEIVKHIESRHFKGFEAYVSSSVGQFEIRSPLMANWVRQYADTVALRTEARKRDVPEVTIRNESRALLAKALVQFEKDYEQQRKRKFPTAPASVKALHDDFLKKRGLGLEVEGLLHAMVPDQLDQNQADEFLKTHIEEVNGVLTVAQIYVRNRDRHTGALLDPERMSKVRKRIVEITRRLEAGDRFEEVARENSDDKTTAAKGGLMENLLRIDPRMPAIFCRAAWSLRDGKWIGPIETRYGVHFVKRVKWLRARHVLRLLAKNKDVRRMIRAYRKEDLLFDVRSSHHVTVKY